MNIFTQISNMQYEGMGLHYSPLDRMKMHEEKDRIHSRKCGAEEKVRALEKT